MCRDGYSSKQALDICAEMDIAVNRHWICVEMDTTVNRHWIYVQRWIQQLTDTGYMRRDGYSS